MFPFVNTDGRGAMMGAAGRRAEGAQAMGTGTGTGGTLAKTSKTKAPSDK